MVGWEVRGGVLSVLRRGFNRAGGRSFGRDESGKMGGILRECVGVELWLGMLDLVYENTYYNETRDGDSNNDPRKSTRIREWAEGEVCVCVSDPLLFRQSCVTHTSDFPGWHQRRNLLPNSTAGCRPPSGRCPMRSSWRQFG